LFVDQSVIGSFIFYSVRIQIYLLSSNSPQIENFDIVAGTYDIKAT